MNRSRQTPADRAERGHDASRFSSSWYDAASRLCSSRPAASDASPAAWIGGRHAWPTSAGGHGSSTETHATTTVSRRPVATAYGCSRFSRSCPASPATVRSFGVYYLVHLHRKLMSFLLFMCADLVVHHRHGLLVESSHHRLWPLVFHLPLPT